MEFLTQEGLKLVLAMVLGGIVQGVRSHLQKTMQEKLEDLNFKRDLEHLKRTQIQYGEVLAELDRKVDRVISFIQNQDGRIKLMESQSRVQQNFKN